MIISSFIIIFEIKQKNSCFIKRTIILVHREKAIPLILKELNNT